MSEMAVPNVKVATLAAAGSTFINYSRKMGRVSIRIFESTSGTPPEAFIKFDAVPGAAAADGQFTLDTLVPGYGEGDIEFSGVGVYAVSACRIEVVAYESVQGVVIR